MPTNGPDELRFSNTVHDIETQSKRKFWPTPQDYNEAVQNLHLNVADEELRHGIAETGPHGLPRPVTGSFASVYRVHCKDRDWALRCFLRDIPDSQARYEQISEFVQNDTLPYTVSFDFQPKGIFVGGSSFPVLKMEWVEGQTLDNYLRMTHNKLPLEFAEAFKKMCLDLKAAGMAHGDLQHGNIIINDGKFFLVDYDGMYVPSMTPGNGHELGHRNYQHPRRTAASFGPNLDNFSSWVIYASLKGLAMEPTLYERLRVGEDCLLFRQSDFSEPSKSRAFAVLERNAEPELRQLSKFIRAQLRVRPEEVPALDAEPSIDVQLPDLFVDTSNATVSFVSSKAEKPLPDWLQDYQAGTASAPPQVVSKSEIVSPHTAWGSDEGNALTLHKELPIVHPIETEMAEPAPRKTIAHGYLETNPIKIQLWCLFLQLVLLAAILQTPQHAWILLWLAIVVFIEYKIWERPFRDHGLVKTGTAVRGHITGKIDHRKWKFDRYELTYRYKVSGMPVGGSMYVNRKQFESVDIDDEVTVVFDPTSLHSTLYRFSYYQAI